MKIKQTILNALNAYKDGHTPTGGFLKAVLENNLKEAIFRADEENLLSIRDIVRYCHNELPSQAWGSPEKVEKWLTTPASSFWAPPPSAWRL